MQDLAARLEAATEGSRGMDVAIAAAVDFRHEAVNTQVRELVNRHGEEWVAVLARSRTGAWRDILPCYTTALTAAAIYAAFQNGWI